MPAGRIVSLIASATETVAALGLGSRLVGRSHECDYPAEVCKLPVCSRPWIDPTAPSAAIDRQVKQRLSQGLSVYNVDADLLRQLRPDLIITQIQCDVCAVSPHDVLPALADWPGPPPQILPLNPASLADFWSDLERVASAAGVPERGRELRYKLEGRMTRLAQRSRHASNPKVVLLEWLDPLMAAGHWMPEMIEMVGAVDPLGVPGGSAPVISWEQLHAADPEYILIAPCGFDLHRTRQEFAALARRPEWQALRAVVAGHVALADGNAFFNRPGPRLVDSLKILTDFIDGRRPDRHWERVPPAAAAMPTVATNSC
jgi:iron complex transport system substrate-binding protein